MAKETIETMNLPQRVKLDAADKKALKKMNDDTAAVQQFVATVQRQGEQRMSQLQDSGRETWMKLFKKYGMDHKSVSYDLSEDGDYLVPRQIILPPE